MPLTAGTRLGPYEIVSVIGAGGMGEVYRARDSKLGRDVALKVLASSVAGDPDRLARFRREAQVLAALNHPNIAAIYGFEDSGPTHALVMELVEGQSLDRLMSSAKPQTSAARPSAASAPQRSGQSTPDAETRLGPPSGPDQALSRKTKAPSASGSQHLKPGVGALPPDQVLSIARQIAEALEFAHERGIIHRDLKPANVKVRDDGTVKVLDFGLAKALAPEDVSGMSDVMNSPTLTARATQVGVIMGTAAYMAPEQAKGRPVDRRADIWAFGVVLYEMLTGRRGYEAEDVSDTLAAVLTRDVDWQALPADTPLRLRALVRDCLARDPKNRLRDIGEARRVLDQMISGAPEIDAAQSTMVAAAAPAAAPISRVLPWTITVAALVAAAAFAWMWRARPPAPAEAVTRSKTTVADLSGFLALSRDGTRFAYTVSGEHGFYIALRQMDQFDSKLLPGSEGGGWPIFSPDGQWMAFSTVLAPTKIKKIPIAGGTSITLCDGTLQNGAAWSDDDTIAFVGPKGLMRVSANGGEPATLTTIDTAKGERSHTRPQFLPGGRSLLLTITSNAADSPHFAVLDLKSNKIQDVARGGDNGQYVPTGHLTFVREATLFAVPFDLARLATTGPEVPVVENIATVGPSGTGDYTFSQNGLLAYSEALDAQGTLLTWLDRHGQPQPIPGQIRRAWSTGRLSPDGLRVVNGINESKGIDLWVADLARGTLTRLTFGGENDFPIWSPDGTHIVYSGSRGGKFALFSVAADGSGQPELLISADTRPVATSFTPDGKTLVYSLPTASKSTIMLMPFGGPAGSPRESRALRESNLSDGQATVSPDGKWVAFTSIESGTAEIYAQAFPGPGAKIQVSTSSGRYPRWNRNGRELLYWTAAPGNAGLMSVTVQATPTLTFGTPKELFRYTPGTTWDVAPDGEHFLVEQTSPTGTGAVFAVVTNWFDELRRRAPSKK